LGRASTEFLEAERTMVNAKQVATLLGVSQSTVSRAFTPTASISPDMRDRVLQAAQEVGYRPNAIARSLITRRSNIVGIVISNPTNPYYPEVLAQFSQALRAIGLQSLLFNIPDSADVEKELPSLLQYQVDSMVLISATIREEVARRYAEEQKLLVLFNLYVPGAEIAAVSCDNIDGGRQVADYVARCGYRRPAFAAGVGTASTSVDRERGFTERLRELGIPLHVRADGNAFSYEAGQMTALSLIQCSPDVIFFANDLMAIGGMDALRTEAGLRIPQDVAVIGFDDQPMAAWDSYSLTTVHRPIDRMVQLTADLLNRHERHEPIEAKPHFVPVSLVERRSSGPKTHGN
jgi:DNA-binding LacI/PurR family transcriptional regulator